jgi:hypothetical protein
MALVSRNLHSLALSTAEKQVKVKTLISQRLSQAFQMLDGTLWKLAQTVWDNPEGLTPQEVLDAVGSDSAALFQVSSLVSQLVAVASGSEPAAVMPLGWTYQINEDGTVSVKQG